MTGNSQMFRLTWLLPWLALGGCAGNAVLSDRLVEDPGAEAFLDRIEQQCGGLSLGNQQLRYLLSADSDDTYFVDATSKLYLGGVDRASYASGIDSFYPSGRNQEALQCIFAQLGG
jgi:hypothetical protein